tara:strand:- start:67 stop:267 length:201 start_codon:yes stop_codon:yes gene_type:complete
MKVGDQIKMRRAPSSYYSENTHDPVVYTILEITDESIAVRHPDIGGYFVFSKDMVAEIVEEKQENK